MVYHGKVKNGVVVLDGPAPAEGTEVRVEPVKDRQGNGTLLNLAGIAQGPSDLARNHDHYAHGKPKK